MSKSALIPLAVACIMLFCPPVALTDFQKTKIAVLDFQLIGDKVETKELGAIISEWFITSLVQTGRFDVVERTNLQKVISEQKLATTGLIDEASASKLGKILGVKAIVTGSALNYMKILEINSRVINVENGAIIAAANVRSDKESDLRASIDHLTAKILNNFPLSGYIVKKEGKSATIDLGVEAGLKIGSEFQVFREGNVIKHPKTNEILDIEHISTGRLRIDKISKNMAEGTILKEENGGVEYGQQVKSLILPASANNLPEKSLTKTSTISTALSPEKKADIKKESREEKKTTVSDKTSIPTTDVRSEAAPLLSQKEATQSINMDSYDHNQLQQILEFQKSGQSSYWLNPTTGNVFNVVPQPAFANPKDPDNPCRAATFLCSNPQGHTEEYRVTSCRQVNGQWTTNK